MGETTYMSDEDQPHIKVHKADKSLQARIGTGPLDDRVVERCQDVMDSNDVDFAPLAMEYLNQLETAIEDAKNSDQSMKETLQSLTGPVMQLKANASTFKYDLIGNLANIMLSFLEAIQEMDDDAISIVAAHHQTLKAIVLKKMTGDGGPVGKQMEDELKGACKRYFLKRQK